MIRMGEPSRGNPPATTAEPHPDEVRRQQRQLIQERARRPRFAGTLPQADAHGYAVNPSCGDTVAVSLRFSGDRRSLAAIRCAVRGCVLCSVSADLMAEVLNQQPITTVEPLASGLAAMLRGEPTAGSCEALRSLGVLAGLPARARCVLLPWQALRHGLGLDQS